jgi:hypothetical protein
MIWAPHNTVYNSIHLKHFNPVPFSKNLFYGFDNNNNVVSSFQMSIHPTENVLLYSQYSLDGMKEKKPDRNATQTGLMVKNTKGNVQLRAEMNIASPFMYSHRNPPQSYSHYNHALAHPFGANFREILFDVYVRYKRFVVYSMLSQTIGGIDSHGSSFGQNVFAENTQAMYSGAWFPQLKSVNSSMFFANLSAHYIFNYQSKLHFFVDVAYRTLDTPLRKDNSVFFQMGVSTKIRYQSKHYSWL